MKKDIINGSIFLLAIVLVVLLCSCTQTNSNMEDFSASLDNDGNPHLILEPKTEGIGKITTSEKLTNEATSILFNADVPDLKPNLGLAPARAPLPPKASDVSSRYCAFIDTNSSLKIAKASAPTSKKNKNRWNIIWDSKLSGYTGNELKMDGEALKLGGNQLGFGIGGVYAKLDIAGDLVICNKKNVAVWSLLASEYSSFETKSRDYLSKTDRTERGELIDAWKSMYLNVDRYTKNISVTSEQQKATYEKLKNIRNKMDFEINQLNGLSNSKISSSIETLQSSMYLNLGITVLATSVFILILTR
jgi:hypothetical protein